MNTSIEWTDRTWNPVRGCSRVSEGCRHCYAERLAARNLPGHRSPTTGEPFAKMRADDPRWTGRVELIPLKLDEPLRWRKPSRVFVNSMSDLFHEAFPAQAIDRVFAVMADAPQHTFQVLTKRPRRMLAYLSGGPQEAIGGWLKGNHKQYVPEQTYRPWPLPNVWLGVSVENQPSADERVPLLLQTPAAKRYVSYEPALGPLDLERGGFSLLRPMKSPSGTKWPGLDWLIVGGESGPGARPFDVSWARSAVRQCKAAGVACFVKQMGARPFLDEGLHDPEDARLYFNDKKGGDPSEWPEDLRVREWP